MTTESDEKINETIGAEAVHMSSIKKNKVTKHMKIAVSFGVAALLLIILYAVFLIYVTYPIDKMTIANAGVFGDSFGVLTSLFSALAFAGVAFTLAMQKEQIETQNQELKIQKDEARLNRSEMKKQAFENTFFQMIKLHNQIVSDISTTIKTSSGTEIVDGRAVIGDFLKRLKNSFEIHNLDETSTKEMVGERFLKYYFDSKYDLGHYFRFLYNILRFLSEATIEDKTLYTRLIRAQLSNVELEILYYNALSTEGKNLIQYMQKFKLMDNLPPERLHHIRYSHFIKDVGFNFKDSDEKHPSIS